MIIMLAAFCAACAAGDFQDRLDAIVPAKGADFDFENVMYGICALGDRDFDAVWCRKYIDNIADGIKASSPGAPGVEAKIAAINAYLFDTLEIKYDYLSCDAVMNSYLTCKYTYRSIENLLRERKGICSQLAVLYMIIGDRFGLPLKAVVLPNHIFLRLDDGSKHLNIDVTSRGSIVPDNFYIRQYGLNFNSPALKSGLPANRYTTVGYMLRDLGSYYRDSKDYDRAIMLFQKAKEVNLDDILCRFELVSCYERSGRLLSSENVFNEMMSYVVTGRKLSVLREMAGYFEKAREEDKNNLYYNYMLGVLYMKLPGKKEQARFALNRVMRMDPGYRNVRELLGRL
jgi:regulator of sirC expression with transglutaminase-like and TPR domain